MLLDAVAIAVVAAGPDSTRAPGAALAELASLQCSFASALASPQPDGPGPPPIPEAAEPAVFGAKDSCWWHVWGGYAFAVEDGSNDQLGIAGGGVSYFLVDDLSLVLELNVLYFDQETQPGFAAAHDGWGVNVALLARWHVLAARRWSIYVEGGAGVIGLTTRVPGPGPDDPRGGSYFNFTPQGGAGVSVALGHDARLLAGCRWYHLSNARTSANNPGSDNVLIYVGATFPF